MSQPTPAAPAVAAPAASEPSKIHIFIIAVLLLGNLAGTGFIIAKMLHPPPPPESKEEIEKKAEAARKAPGPIVPMEVFVVNLNEPNSARYLKTAFELELSRPTAPKEIEEQKRGIRDDILSYLSSLSVADTLGDVGKQKIKGEVIKRVDKNLGAGTVKRLFFTEFVVQ